MEYYDNAARGMERGAVSLLEDVGARSRFLTRTYLNLTGAVAAFATIETLLFAFCGDAIVNLFTASGKLTVSRHAQSNRHNFFIINSPL